MAKLKMFDTILTKENDVKLFFPTHYMPLYYLLDMWSRDHMFYKCDNDWSSVSSFFLLPLPGYWKLKVTNKDKKEKKP